MGAGGCEAPFCLVDEPFTADLKVLLGKKSVAEPTGVRFGKTAPFPSGTGGGGLCGA